ncbi:MAG: VOC family protein [Paracoccaceae bacterium]|nr:VOC family protein [Paracoccaceae bacterium]
MTASLEHLNVTVPDPDRTASMLEDLFGWHIRWSGAALGGGRTIHIGTETGYVALYAPPRQTGPGGSSYATTGGLNHIGVVVDDLGAVEAKVKARGLTPTNHGDYEPGRRFYFDDPDGLEFEVVSYD